MIHLSKDQLSQYESAMQLEWLHTNGLGSYASETSIGSHTRRYHGLLVAALKPPRNRFILLSRVEGVVVVGGETIDLETNQYRMTVHPKGYKNIASFKLDPMPVWTYEFKGVQLQKTVFMPHGRQQVVIVYRLLSTSTDQPVALEVKPLLAYRDYHSLSKENSFLNSEVVIEQGKIKIKPYQELPALELNHNAQHFETESKGWYRQFEYLKEMERGMDAYEDLYCMGTFKISLKQGETFYLLASIEPDARGITLDKVKELETAERERTRSLYLSSDDDFTKSLRKAADQFVVKSREGSSGIIAGYHWFSDWGRDSMISIPGLLLNTGKEEQAKSILLNLLEFMDKGMLPNYFPEAGETPEYNTVDAALWMFEGIRQYLDRTQDLAFLRQVWPKLKEVIHFYQTGTRYGIVMDPEDGLLQSGEAGIQLTWMDAKVGDWVVTPRSGKAVEINALWYQALLSAGSFARLLGEEGAANQFVKLASKVKKSFALKFWNENKQCLYDYINKSDLNAQIRPNQIFAVSLSNHLLPKTIQRAVVSCVEKHLLTPFGLRSLSPEDPQYQGRYEGNPLKRDGAYHQGTVWAWLIGPYITAYLNAFGRTAHNLKKTRKLLHSFEAHLCDSGLGSISEIFDGDAPHTARGCIAQAWSVAEVLRVLLNEFNSDRSKSDISMKKTKKVTSPNLAFQNDAGNEI